MLWTILAFLVITSLSVYFHLRKPERAPAARPARPRIAACPRCRTAVPAGAVVCPGCRVPLQLFDVVAAAVAPEASADTGGAMRAHVRSDMCVGCGTCVDACPEPNAIALRGKLAVVDPVHCVGHGECATACPVGAIAMSAGAAVNRVVVPQVDGNFETNVPGLYIVGELGGRGLIKNAINEGKVAIEHVRRTVSADTTPAATDATVDVAIVGSGPAGLSAGLEALRSGLTYVVLEQGSLADSVRKYPRHKLLFAEPLNIPMYGDLHVADGSKEELLKAWEDVVAKTGLRVETERRVEDITRQGWLFRLRAGVHEYRARRVVLAMGRRGTARRLGVPGEELGKVFYDVAEMEDFAERHVLVVGGGDTAIETVLGLANQAGTTVTLSYRGDRFARLKDRLRQKLDRAIAIGTVHVVLNSTVREIRGDVVVLDAAGAPLILPNDDVIIRIGGDPPSAFLERMGVRMVQKEIPLEPDVAQAG
jgi:thioredoxin reductase/Pyruvate/2-oxoacid:ferredoxin oxidoreductase delta subunit